MNDFSGRTAVITGGGTGMGRALAVALVKEHCHVAICDVSEDAMAETQALCQAVSDVRVTTHLCDVSSEEDINRFQQEVEAAHGEAIHLLFNNAGIGVVGSIVHQDRHQWERTFNICWYGVYYGCTTFLPMLQASNESHIINTSSVNGFWASIGPDLPHTAYCAAKFAVKGFTEALITDLRLNAPNVHCSLVMPGHIGTSIVANSRRLVREDDANEPSHAEVVRARNLYLKSGSPVDNLPDEHIREMLKQEAEDFRDKALTSAEDAAAIILSGVKEKRWRILVGEDAEFVDKFVREDPESAYELEFFERLAERQLWTMSGSDGN